MVSNTESIMYPCLIIENPEQPFRDIFGLITPGDLQLVVRRDNQLIKIKTIGKSAYNIQMLMNTCPRVYYAKSKYEQIHITKMEDYMGVV